MKQDRSEALEIAVYAGIILLQSGAEIFRVDETVERITRAYGVESCSSFVLSSGLFTTAGNQQEEYFAKVRHVPLSSARLDKVEAVNELSREIARGQHTPRQALAQLRRIDAMPRRPALARLAASGLGSAAATLACLLLFRLGVGQDLNQMVIGSIVPLLPGLPFTIAIREKCPVTAFLISGILPLVPGAGIYWTTYHMLTGQSAEALRRGVETGKIAAAMVLAIVLVFELPQGLFRVFGRRARP